MADCSMFSAPCFHFDPRLVARLLLLGGVICSVGPRSYVAIDSIGKVAPGGVGIGQGENSGEGGGKRVDSTATCRPGNTEPNRHDHIAASVVPPPPQP